ncbi:MAG TPA: chorismate mutase [Candidatus Bathyarchaeota archaeon]|nr:chorismate mutase [Candidatus Bathyarchaeota archaeon]HEX68994.1 chorismate mutase [Candidatus Bathyarchaeota archaeon]
MDEIANLRKKIDEIDEKILLLLKERVEISKLIGKIKQEKGKPIRDVQREDEKYRHIAKRASELGLDLKTVKDIYRNIIAMSIQAQEQSKSNDKSPS